MKKSTPIFLYLLTFFLLTSCYDDFDDKINSASTENNKNFVYEGLKIFYLYKEEVNELADTYFSDSEDLKTYLSGFNSPEELFQTLTYHEDRFSIIVPDFHVLENQLNGITLHNGMAYGLVKISATGKVFGYVRYVLPNSSAETQGVERGMIFNKIDGVTLTETNYSQLLKPEQYTINLATLQDDELTSLEESISLTKTELQENPIYDYKIIEQDDHKVGYLVYNAFTKSFDDELNAVFGHFKAEGITDLVIDLRYNGGGSIETSRSLAGMITGQFTGELFTTEHYNLNFEDEELLFKNNLDNGATLNQLQLDEVTLLTSKSTASASELLLNSLRPYINVVQIGDWTVGKFQGSVTLYDSPDFRRTSVRPGHTYAMQPLILKTINANGYTDYHEGLEPDILQKEDFSNLGQLGDPQEPLLQLALENITGTPSLAKPYQEESEHYLPISETHKTQTLFQKMYTNSLK